MKLAIKNMVCPRCVTAVREILSELGYPPVDVRLGYALLKEEELPPEALATLAERLKKVGFELLQSDDKIRVEQIKRAVIRYVRQETESRINLSAALEKDLGQNYKMLTAVFSRSEGRTIERYYIYQRIEYVKELLSYGELTLTEIAYRVGYSSVAYLSRQFSQVVGLTVTEYRLQGDDLREPIDQV